MKQTMKRIATGMAWSLIILTGTDLVAAPEASAHGVTKSRHVDYSYRGPKPAALNVD